MASPISLDVNNIASLNKQRHLSVWVISPKMPCACSQGGSVGGYSAVGGATGKRKAAAKPSKKKGKGKSPGSPKSKGKGKRKGRK